MTDDRHNLGRAWAVVVLLAIVGGLNYLDRNMILTMRKSIIAAVPMNEAQFGLLTSIFLWVYGLLSPFAGFLADRFSRSRVIIGSLCVWSFVTWLTAHASTFGELLAARALMGLSEACYIPAALALIADYHRGSTRSTATGLHMAGIYVGQAFGGIGGWLAERHSWNFPFTIFGLIGIAYSALLFFTLRDAPLPPASSDESLAPTTKANGVRFGSAVRSLLGSSSFRTAFFFFGLLGVVGWLIAGWLPTYFQERFNLSQGTAGFSATSYSSGASLTGVLLGGWLADQWSRTNPRGRILVPAIGLCIAACGVLTLSVTHVLGFAIAGIALYGLTRTFTDANMMPILCLIADPRYRSTGYGLLNMLSSVIGGIGIYAGGALRDARVDLSVVYLVAVLCLLICAFLLFRLKPLPSASAPASAAAIEAAR